MTKKEAFIDLVNYFFEDNDVRFENDEKFQLAKEFFEDSWLESFRNQSNNRLYVL